MSRVFVTGAAGSVGAAVTQQLLAAGHDVAVLARQERPARLAPLLYQVTLISGDLADTLTFSPALRRFAPEAIVHAAWLGVANGQRDDPQQAQNVDYARSLMGLASSLHLKHLIAFGSQAEYGPHEGPLDESAATRPTTKYGQTKLECFELMSELAKEQGLPFTWLRLFSAYGPGDDPRWVIQSVARQLLAGQSPALSAGTQRWDFLYLSDVGAAVAAVLKSGATGVYNLGSGQAPTLRQTLEQLRDLIDPHQPLGFGQIPFGPGQVMHLEADIRKLSAATGWTPKVGLAEGLKHCVDALKAA